VVFFKRYFFCFSRFNLIIVLPKVYRASSGCYIFTFERFLLLQVGVKVDCYHRGNSGSGLFFLLVRSKTPISLLVFLMSLPPSTQLILVSLSQSSHIFLPQSFINSTTAGVDQLRFISPG